MLLQYPQHIQEQYLYRIQVCKDKEYNCLEERYCVKCGCPTLKKMWAPEADECDYPDFMSGLKWKEYKEKNNIKIELDV